MGNSAGAFVARLNSNGDAWRKYLKISAVGAGLPVMLFPTAAIFDIQHLPKQKYLPHLYTGFFTMGVTIEL
jgi:hypothetical protein